MKSIRFYVVTDGSAIGNPGPGGWAAVIRSGNEKWHISGSCPLTTSSEMELLAAVEALRTLPAKSRVELRSDSAYLIHGMRYLVARWKRRGWRNRRGLPLPHQMLWKELLVHEKHLEIRWTWVRGHSGDLIQEFADSLAFQEARRQTSRIPEQPEDRKKLGAYKRLERRHTSGSERERFGQLRESVQEAICWIDSQDRAAAPHKRVSPSIQ